MKPSAEDLLAATPTVTEALVHEHLTRLDNEYFERFSLEAQSSHLRCLARLDRENPVEVLVDELSDNVVSVTILAFDHTGVFSLITGVLSSMHVEIGRGDVYTYDRAVYEKPTRPRRIPRYQWPHGLRETLKRRRIIDHFEGTRTDDAPFAVWRDELIARMQKVMHLVDREDNHAAAEAKQAVNEWVIDTLSRSQEDRLPILYPVNVVLNAEVEKRTQLQVTSQDTPAFLYTLTAALSMHRLSIERVRIRTEGNHILDDIALVDRRGEPIRDPDLLAQIQFSVLLTRQFTYFLGQAPDPFRALSRFESMVEDLASNPNKEQWQDLFSNPYAMSDLARLLGASDFLWEDFIRLQYESLFPLLGQPGSANRYSHPPDQLRSLLNGSIAQGETLAAKSDQLNAFKDREIYLIDLDHLLTADCDFREFAERLTLLAEIVVRAAAELAYASLLEQYGEPCTVAGLSATYAIFGLGKMGGAALGYASDIELLLVYSDNGMTNGKRSISNAEFFDRLVLEITQIIRSKRKGIFEIDLRLRPYGDSGPRACSLQSFMTYYAQGQIAHAYELLALVRLRAIAGDSELGARVERIRDTVIYAGNCIDPRPIYELRAKQYQEKTKPGQVNAKFSRGGLVDLEYTVQLLQVIHGPSHPAIRTPRIHEALKGMAQLGIMDRQEASRLNDAYDFFRKLINALRMLRGSAIDLFLPRPDSLEYVHLARRTGYRRDGDLSAGDQLHVELATHSAVVRSFVDAHFGQDSLPGRAYGNAVDLILMPDPSEHFVSGVLTPRGFHEPKRAYANLMRLVGHGERKAAFLPLSILAVDALKQVPDPDMALNNWERFVEQLADPVEHFREFLSQPKRLSILLSLFAHSQFLADTLIRDTEFLSWVTDPANLQRTLTRNQLLLVLGKALDGNVGLSQWMDELRRLRRREILRIGTRDLCLHVPLMDVMEELSVLADCIVQLALDKVWHLQRDKVGSDLVEELSQNLCILAFGKLGGRELNYSSDIDLLPVVDDKRRSEHFGLYIDVVEQLRDTLARYTAQGCVYRVDFRLRPYGAASELVQTVEGVGQYYMDKAVAWEIQAMLKLRAMAGNLEVGGQLLKRIQPLLFVRHDPGEVLGTIETMRDTAVRRQAANPTAGIDVKTGRGGIRDIEFLVQGYQLAYASVQPGIVGGHTLRALHALWEAGYLSDQQLEQLEEDYIFLRKVEHSIQLLHDRQTHHLPEQEDQLLALGRRMSDGFTSAQHVVEELQRRMCRVRETYTTCLQALR